jgi:hypothetical protein
MENLLLLLGKNYFLVLPAISLLLVLEYQWGLVELQIKPVCRKRQSIR